MYILAYRETQLCGTIIEKHNHNDKKKPATASRPWVKGTGASQQDQFKRKKRVSSVDFGVTKQLVVVIRIMNLCKLFCPQNRFLVLAMMLLCPVFPSTLWTIARLFRPQNNIAI